jgi:hypothetical protein
MKSYKIFIICVFGLTSFASCSSDKDEVETSQGVPMSISTEIMQTRSVINSTSFIDGDKIGVYALNAEGTQYDNGSMNMLSAFNGNNWTFPTGSVYLKTADATVYSYYPYDAINTTTSVSVNIIPNSSTGQTDYLYGSAAAVVNSTNPKAQITFKHALSMVCLSITRADVGTGAGSITKVALKNASAKTALSTSGTMNIISGSITPIADHYATLSADINKTLDAVNPVTAEFLFIPVTTSNDLVLTISVDGRMYDVVLPPVDFKAGNKYVFPVSISVNNNKMTVGQCAITEWSSTTVNSTSVSDDNYTNDAHVVDLGLSVYWADCNVGATKAEDYGTLCGWADNTGEKTSTSSSDYPSSNPPTNICGDTQYDLARAKWGGNWRLPTNSELEELCNNCTKEWTTLNGVKGYRFTSNKTGFTDKSIFLPAAGLRSGTTISSQGVSGIYWSGTLVPNYSQWAYCISLNDGYVSTSNTSRNSCSSVRPVMDK